MPICLSYDSSFPAEQRERLHPRPRRRPRRIFRLVILLAEGRELVDNFRVVIRRYVSSRNKLVGVLFHRLFWCIEVLAWAGG